MKLQVSDLPLTGVEPKSLDTFLEEVKKDVEYLDHHYSSAYNLLGDAMKGAMSWAPQVVMKKAQPDVNNLYTLAVQLLAVCYATERSKGPSEVARQ